MSIQIDDITSASADAAAQVEAHNESAGAHGLNMLRFSPPSSIAAINAFTEAMDTDVVVTWGTTPDPALAKNFSFNSGIPTFATLVGGFWYSYNGYYTASTYVDGTIPYQHKSGFALMSDAPKIEICVLTSDTANMHIRIDDKEQTISTVSGSRINRYASCVHAGGRKMRRWEFTFFAGAIRYISIATDSTSVLLPAGKRPQMVVVGDSYAAATANIADPSYGYPTRVARMLGGEVVSFDDSGTGYAACGGQFASNDGRQYLKRLQRFDTGSYSGAGLVLCQSSINDTLANLATNSIPVTTYAQIRSAARECWTYLRLMHPHARIVVTSPIGSPGNSGVETLSTELESEFGAWADPLSTWIGCRGVYTSENAATVLVNNHPTDAGYMYLSRYLADIIATLAV